MMTLGNAPVSEAGNRIARASLVAAMIFTLVIAITAPAGAQGETPTGTVRAFSIDCSTGEPSIRVGTTDSIEGCVPVPATLTFYLYGDNSSEPTSSLVTDASGFGLINLPQGTYAVVVEETQASLDIEIVAGQETPLLIGIPSAGESPADPDTPPARDYTSCGHFETQADAQAVLDSGTLDETGVASLDSDGDGIACEDAFGNDTDEAAPAAPASSTATVSGLPKTGSGLAAEVDGPLVAFAAMAALSCCGAVTARWQTRR